MLLGIDLIMGLVLGIEHLSGEGDEEDEYQWMIAIHLGIFRITILKL
jgi:hypothetical protein